MELYIDIDWICMTATKSTCIINMYIYIYFIFIFTKPRQSLWQCSIHQIHSQDISGNSTMRRESTPPPKRWVASSSISKNCTRRMRATSKRREPTNAISVLQRLLHQLFLLLTLFTWIVWFPSGKNVFQNDKFRSQHVLLLSTQMPTTSGKPNIEPENGSFSPSSHESLGVSNISSFWKRCIWTQQRYRSVQANPPVARIWLIPGSFKRRKGPQPCYLSKNATTCGCSLQMLSNISHGGGFSQVCAADGCMMAAAVFLFSAGKQESHEG